MLGQKVCSNQNLQIWFLFTIDTDSVTSVSEESSNNSELNTGIALSISLVGGRGSWRVLRAKHAVVNSSLLLGFYILKNVRLILEF